MAENKRSQRSRQGSQDNQEGGLENQTSNQRLTEQSDNNRQDVNSRQIGRLESQPGNMSGVNIEDQRSRSGNQDLGSRGSDMESRESL